MSSWVLKRLDGARSFFTHANQREEKSWPDSAPEASSRYRRLAATRSKPALVLLSCNFRKTTVHL
jgi:hypothetical protein